MSLASKKYSIIILALTALIFSRGMFVFFNDPEGPNLLIVGVVALILYLASLTVFLFSAPDSKKLSLAMLIQLLLAVGLYILGSYF